MEIIIPKSRNEKIKTYPFQEKKPNPKNYNWLWLVVILVVVMAAKFADFVDRQPDGGYILKPKRKRELERRKGKLDESEQYALKATINGWYECHNCGKETQIYLYIGEVWKYGVSRNGVRRYASWEYKENDLAYIMEYKGTLTECSKRELEQIYNYPLLPENLKRDFKLPRPPGNKKDH